MRYRIYFKLPDGSDDYVVVSGDTHDEIRERADEEVSKRNGSNPWSEQLSPFERDSLEMPL